MRTKEPIIKLRISTDKCDESVPCLLTLRGNLCSWPPWRETGSNFVADGLIHGAYIDPPRQPWKCKQVVNDRV